MLLSGSMKFAIVALGIFLAACTAKTEIPLEFPSPQFPATATPVPKLELKRDEQLERQFAEIARDAKGRVGVAAVVLETGDAALLNADDHYPMQSVYKLPISMAVMEQVRLGKLDLNTKVKVLKDDMVRPGQASPLRDKNPNGGEFTIRELIRLALVESDGTASDVLLRILGGPSEAKGYLTQIGIPDMKIVNTEKELGRDWDTQNRNWTTPVAAIKMLRHLCLSAEKKVVTTPALSNLLPSQDSLVDCPAVVPMDIEPGWENQLRMQQVLYFMASSVTGPRRLKGLLPRNTVVAHKTGTSGTAKKGQRFTTTGPIIADGIYTADSTPATNDIGIIYLPNGKHLAIAVFVSDSPADEKTREAVIARIANAAWDRWNAEARP